MSSRHHFRITASFGPADLFQLLRRACDYHEAKRAHAEFDFDWLKRRIAITADSEEAAEHSVEWVMGKVREKAGPGMLLPGDAEKREDGRVTVPVGVLLQTPDVYIEMMARMLTEMGLTSIRLEGEDGFSIAVSHAARALEYEATVKDFPLPGYLKLEDGGVRPDSA